MLQSLPIKQYLALREELDARCNQLSGLHSIHMNCRAGCDQCCMDFSIFPVEYHAIRLECAETIKDIKESAPGACPFLINNRCVIYNSRPFICRTQGLPLLFMNDDNWELSVCELNFTEFDFQEFTDENTFPQDRFNSALYMINKAFIKSLPDKKYGANDLIPLRNLVICP